MIDRETLMHPPGDLERRLRRLAGRAIGDFGLIRNNDTILVGLSGGKDSWTLLHLLNSLRERAPVHFSIIAVTVHPGFAEYRTGPLERYLRTHRYEYRIVHAPIREILASKLRSGDSPCSLCSRIRRGVLYTQARELRCTKIALGHHREDFIETLLLNMFYNGKIKAMAPLLLADDGRNVVIRPLLYAAEEDIASFARAQGFPLAPPICPSCSDSDMKRLKIKNLLSGLEREHPGIKASLLASLGHVELRHLPIQQPPTAGELKKNREPETGKNADWSEIPE